MPRSSRTKQAATRASFGRAERLQRERADGSPGKPAPSRQRDAAARAGRAPQQESKKTRAERTAPTETAARVAARERKLTALDVVVTRAERARDASDRRRQQRLKEQTRDTFNEKAQRRRDTERRQEHDRKREALQVKVRRVEDNRRRTSQRMAERKRAEMRKSFAATAENRKALAAAARQKEMERRAAAQVEQEQKRRAADQQTEHRRQTSEMRDRHKNELHSFRSNEDAAMARHHNAIKGINDREAGALDHFMGSRHDLGLMGKMIPGLRAKNDRKEQEIIRGFEAERQTKHRDYEALKERQFEVAQRNRLQQAQERKALMELHRDDRTKMQQDHAKDRPGLIEGRTRVLDRVDREQAQERPEPGHDANRSSMASAWAGIKKDTQSENSAGSAAKESERPEPDRPAPSRDMDRAFERYFDARPM